MITASDGYRVAHEHLGIAGVATPVKNILGIPPGEVSIDWTQVIFKGLTLKGIYGREMFETWYKMSSMLESGLDISPILTHHFPADAYLEGFEVMRSGQSGKVILDWT